MGTSVETCTIADGIHDLDSKLSERKTPLATRPVLMFPLATEGDRQNSHMGALSTLIRRANDLAGAEYSTCPRPLPHGLTGAESFVPVTWVRMAVAPLMGVKLGFAEPPSFDIRGLVDLAYG